MKGPEVGLLDRTAGRSGIDALRASAPRPARERSLGGELKGAAELTHSDSSVLPPSSGTQSSRVGAGRMPRVGRVSGGGGGGNSTGILGRRVGSPGGVWSTAEAEQRLLTDPVLNCANLVPDHHRNRNLDGEHSPMLLAGCAAGVRICHPWSRGVAGESGRGGGGGGGGGRSPP